MPYCGSASVTPASPHDPQPEGMRCAGDRVNAGRRTTPVVDLTPSTDVMRCEGAACVAAARAVRAHPIACSIRAPTLPEPQPYTHLSTITLPSPSPGAGVPPITRSYLAASHRAAWPPLPLRPARGAPGAILRGGQARCGATERMQRLEDLVNLAMTSSSPCHDLLITSSMASLMTSSCTPS